MFTKDELETILYTLEGYLQSTNDDKYGDELVRICDKIIQELPPIVVNLPEGTNLSKVTITPQELEGDISTVTDSDYADKVDTLVGNMVASDDNNIDKVYPEVDDVPDNIKKEWLYNYTHDSEGC